MGPDFALAAAVMIDWLVDAHVVKIALGRLSMPVLGR